MSQVRTQQVRLRATDAVELEPGIVMPAGLYPGERKEIGVPMMGGKISWTPPEYSIVFTGEQLLSMGMKTTQNLVSIDWDVTTFVKLKQITVA